MSLRSCDTQGRVAAAMEDAPSHQPAQVNYTKHETELNNELSEDAEQLAHLAQLTVPPGNVPPPDAVVRAITHTVLLRYTRILHIHHL